MGKPSQNDLFVLTWRKTNQTCLSYLFRLLIVRWLRYFQLDTTVILLNGLLIVCHGVSIWRFCRGQETKLWFQSFGWCTNVGSIWWYGRPMIWYDMIWYNYERSFRPASCYFIPLFMFVLFLFVRLVLSYRVWNCDPHWILSIMSKTTFLYLGTKLISTI